MNVMTVFTVIVLYELISEAMIFGFGLSKLWFGLANYVPMPFGPAQ